MQWFSRIFYFYVLKHCLVLLFLNDNCRDSAGRNTVNWAKQSKVYFHRVHAPHLFCLKLMLLIRISFTTFLWAVAISTELSLEYWIHYELKKMDRVSPKNVCLIKGDQCLSPRGISPNNKHRWNWCFKNSFLPSSNITVSGITKVKNSVPSCNFTVYAFLCLVLSFLICVLIRNYHYEICELDFLCTVEPVSSLQLERTT